MRPVKTLGATLGYLIRFAQDQQLALLGNGQGELLLARYLLGFQQTKSLIVPGARLIEIGHLDPHVADPSKWNVRLLRWLLRRLFSYTELHGIAIGIEDEQGFLDRA